MKNTFLKVVSLLFILVITVFVIHPHHAFAATITVNDIGDDSDATPGDGICETVLGNNTCTFRAAIQESNATIGVIDNIDFNISGSGAHIITLTSPLTSINDPVTIDGTTQDGSSCGDLWGGISPVWNIVIDANNLSDSHSVGIDIEAPDTIVKGIEVKNVGGGTFAGYGIHGSRDNMVVQCSYSHNNWGGIGTQGNNALLGGTNPGEGNLSNLNRGFGITSYGSNNRIQGNFISTDVTGMSAAPNENNSVYIELGDGNIVGGLTPGARNLISGSNSNGIYIKANVGITNTLIQGNYIGVARDGTTILGNGGPGIQDQGAGGTIIGGTDPAAGNIIAGSGQSGISIETTNGIATIQGNSIHDNSGDGINLSTGLNVVDSNTIYSNGHNGITASGAGGNIISSNTIYDHGSSLSSSWTAAISPLKYNATVFNQDPFGVCNGNPLVLYTTNFNDFAPICSGFSNSVPGPVESGSGGSWDAFLIGVGGNINVTIFLPNNLFDRVSLENMIGGTVSAAIHGILTKSGNTWIYNGVVDGVNGVAIETVDGGVVSLDNLSPMLTLSTPAYSFSAINLLNTVSNTISGNNIHDNGFGITFAGSSYNNLVSSGSFTGSLGYDFVSTASGDNTIGIPVSFHTKSVTGSGQLIILGIDPTLTTSKKKRTFGFIPIDPSLISKSTTTQPSTKQNLCSTTQILTQNLKTGARNGKYNSYTKAIVKEAHILQAQLNRLGFSSGKVDGILGPISDGAIKRMQTFLKTTPDGYVGPITRGLINNSCGVDGLNKS